MVVVGLVPRLFVMYMWFFIAEPTSKTCMYSLLETVKTLKNFQNQDFFGVETS